MLLVMLLLLNLRTLYLINNVFINDLLVLLQKELLTKDNKMLTIVCKALMRIKVLGLNYDSIHACTNYGCVLF
jgi:hypothetical protein